MIGRFQSYNRMKIKVKENLINSWTHLKDGLSGSEGHPPESMFHTVIFC